MDANPEVTKRCPFCSESILLAAIKCKHCQSDLRAGAQGVGAAQAKSSSEVLGIVMLVLPLASTFLIWFWVGEMNLLQSPGSTLSLIGGSTILGTAILVAIEAQGLGAGSPTDRDQKGRPRSGPVTWFVLLVLLWIVGFPMWLFQRSRYGLKNLVVGGVVTALIFAASWAVMGSAIESKKSDIRHRFRHLEGNAGVGGGALINGAVDYATLHKTPPAPLPAVSTPTALSAPAPSPLVVERIAVAAGYAVRIGFERRPTSGEDDVLHVFLADVRGSKVINARVEAGVRSGGEHEDRVPLTSDGDGYRGAVSFRAPGLHHLRLSADPPGGRRLTASVEFDVLAAQAPVVDAPL